MNINEIFNKGIEAGKAGDSRTEEQLSSLLRDKNEEYLKSEGVEKEYFDKDELVNPYMDSAIYFDSGKEIRKIFVGIDTEVQEILLADKLNVDMVLGHHPEGKALLNLYKVMNIHMESLINHGVPVNVAEKLVEERQEELERNLHGVNYNRVIDAAKLLKISFMNIHTAADNLAGKFMEEFFKSKNINKLGDIVELSLEIEEYKVAAKDGLKAKIISGSDKNRVGNIFVKFNGGTSGNKKIFKYLESCGVSTFVCMHLPENHLEEAKKHNINVVVMPHMASDSLGMNLLLGEIERKLNTKFEIVAGSGFIRVER